MNNKKYLAHLKNDLGDYHYLDCHLKCVGELAEKYMCEANMELGEMAKWSGLLHDLGKYREEFLEYIKSEGKIKSSHETHHAIYGAAMAFLKGWNVLAFAIAGHHAGLHNFEDLKNSIKKPEYKIDSSNVLQDLQEKFETELQIIPQTFNEIGFIKNNYQFEFATRMIFSALIDADRYDTARHANNWKMPETPKLNPTELLKKLEKFRQAKSENAKKNGIDKKLLKLRNKIFDDCLREAERERGFFSLTVPTGGAKTLSAMAFALRHIEFHNARTEIKKLSRVIVVIPYLSIIEQNAKEYREAFGNDVVIENHSAVEVEEKPDDDDDMNPLTLITENWDAPIIVTTSVQFIESLFARKPSKCRKLHNIANSVVIFDEIQTLPAKLLEPLFNVWKELKENYGVSFVFSTATQPGFVKQHSFPSGFEDEKVLRPIISETDTEQIYKELNRITYDFSNFTKPQTWAEIANEMKNEQQILCVVNTRKQAFELWSELQKQLNENDRTKEETKYLFHLSSMMCAEHRLEIIEKIKQITRINWKREKRNRIKIPCRVVSTQLVEAGVDLDFPILFRAIAPLDSIVQAAGRCNREGKLTDEKSNSKKGRVKVFTPSDESLPSGIYRLGTNQSKRILPKITPESLATDYMIFSDYFANLYDDAVDDMAKGKEIQKDRKKYKFKDVAFNTKVIDDSGTPVIVHYQGKERNSSKIIQELREKHSNKGLYVDFLELKKDLRKLQRLMVNLREKEFNELLTYGKLEKFLPNNDLEMFVLKEENVKDKKNYDQDLGIRVKEIEATDFIQ